MSDTNKAFDRLHDELASWRTKIDELRLRGHLAKREVVEKVDELETDFERAFVSSREKMRELKTSAGDEWTAVLLSIESGWAELKKTYDEASSRETKSKD